MHSTRPDAVEDQPMTTITRGPRRDIVLNDEVCAVTEWQFTSSAEPQTRLFWD
jgi:hypothetical protein